MSQPTLRLDKWLWQARFFKSRTLAGRFCAAGRVRVNGAPGAKARFRLRPGDVLTFAPGREVRIVRVRQLGQRRGPAPEARLLYEDLEPAAPATTPSRRRPGAGRPTKADRRAVDRLRRVP